MATRILFVEDEINAVSAYMRELKNYDFDCVYAGSGDEAIAKLESEKFDILSIDIMLFNKSDRMGADIDPIQAGLRLYEMVRGGEIKNCNPAMAIVVLSAMTEPKIEESIRHLQIDEFLQKPLDFEYVMQKFLKLQERLMKNGQDTHREFSF
ncbi:response regulator [candidate division KSB1 bacterium]|nr:response regulator [candidate division KSB1 bacterium]